MHARLTGMDADGSVPVPARRAAATRVTVGPALVLALQRSAGNGAVARRLAEHGHVGLPAPGSAPVVQRCGPVPCDCSSEERAQHAARNAAASADNAAPEALESEPSAPVQRVHVDASTGRKVFDCTAFFGQPPLDACLNDEGRLGPPRTGSAVVQVQDALRKDGADLGPNGVDGVYGPATANAVRTFKDKYDLGFSQYGDVGPGTMDKLDQLCLGRQNPSPTPPPQPLSDDLIVKVAKSDRDAALREAGNKLRELDAALRDGTLPVGRFAATASAVAKWMLVPTTDSGFPDTVHKALTIIDSNALVQTTITIDRNQKKDFAHVGAIGDPTSGIVIEDAFFGSNVRCQHEVMAHEFFHLSGLVHAYGTADPDEAMNCPHHMAELVFDLATGQTGGCLLPPQDDLQPLP